MEGARNIGYDTGRLGKVSPWMEESSELRNTLAARLDYWLGFRNLRSGLRIGFADALTMDSDFCAPDGSDSLSHTSTVGSVVS